MRFVVYEPTGPGYIGTPTWVDTASRLQGHRAQSAREGQPTRRRPSTAKHGARDFPGCRSRVRTAGPHALCVVVDADVQVTSYPTMHTRCVASCRVPGERAPTDQTV